MADLVITPGNVVPDDGYQSIRNIVAGETITAGMGVYLKDADKRYYKGDCTTSLETATLSGIALQGVSAGQPMLIWTGGDGAIGATVVVGKIYVLSEAGLFAPVDDLAASDYVSIGFIGITTSKVRLAITNSGVQVP